MKHIILIAMFLIAFSVKSQQTRLVFGVGGILPAGLSTDIYLFKKKAAIDLGVGVFGVFSGARVNLGTWSIGTIHGLQLMPSTGGWRTLPYISKTFELDNLSLQTGGGVRMDWFDRSPEYTPSFFIRVSRK
jgi:hypothetical protein